MDTQPGQALQGETLDQDLRRIFGRGDFEHVGYRLADLPGIGQVLTVDVAEKSWGPHFLRFGLGLSTDFSGTAYFVASASHRWTWLNRLGAEWRNDLQIGGVDCLRSEWYQPLSPSQRSFVAAWAEHKREPFDIYEEHQRLVRLRLQQSRAGIDFGIPLQTWGEFRIGAFGGRTRFGSEVSILPASALPSEKLGALAAQLRLDTLDSLRFPRSGFAAKLRLERSLRSLGASSDYSKLSAEWRSAFSVGRHTLRFGASGAGAVGSTNELPGHELSSLGGFLQLSGYRTGEFIGRDMRFARMVYTYQLRSAGFLEGMVAGLSAEAGRIGDNVTGPNTAATRHGNALFLGVDTPFGPLYLGYGRASASAQAVYLFLGQP
jgi:NTE family protein